MDQQTEFCREPVAVLVAAIVASIIDPVVADLPEMPHLHPQQSGEAHPHVQEVAGRLASLLAHYDARVKALQKFGMPDQLANEYREFADATCGTIRLKLLKHLLVDTAAFQLQMPPRGEESQH